jgi:hypothetical protein
LLSRSGDNGSGMVDSKHSGVFRPLLNFAQPFGPLYSGSLSERPFDWSSHDPIFKPAVSASSDASFLDGGHAGKTPGDYE